MFKKFMCFALSIMMVFCTISTTAFAASHEVDDVVVSHVTFTEDGKATVTIANNSEADSKNVVFWLGEYVDGVLVESKQTEVITLAAGAKTDPALELSLTSRDARSVMKAYVWEDVVGGKPYAPAATYPSSSTDVLYVEKDGEAWAEFNSENKDYVFELERTNFVIPQFDFFAKDNSTQIIEPETYEVGENKIDVIAADGTKLTYTITIKYELPKITNIKATSAKVGAANAYRIFDANKYRDPRIDRPLLKEGAEVVLSFDRYSYISDEEWRAVSNVIKYVSDALEADGYGKYVSGELDVDGDGKNDKKPIDAVSIYQGYPALSSGYPKEVGDVIETKYNINSAIVATNFAVGNAAWSDPIERGYIFPVKKGLYATAEDPGQYSSGEILSFEINHPGTFYLTATASAISCAETPIDLEGTGFVLSTDKKFTHASMVYEKHFDAGDVVSVPGLGVTSWKTGSDAGWSDSSRTADNSPLFFVFDEENYYQPEPFDSADATLKTLSYTLNGVAIPLDLTGEKIFNIDVPTGTTEIDAITAVKNVSFAKLEGAPAGEVVLEDGAATVVLVVTSYDGTKTETYTINFTEILPAEDNATLKGISYSYKVGEEEPVNEDVAGFDAATETYVVELPEGAENISVEAEAAVGNDRANVEVTVSEIVDYEATATIVVTAIDGETTKEYTVTFDIERPLSALPNKVYDLSSPCFPVLSTNRGYQTEEEASESPITGVAVGEGLERGTSFMYYTSGGHKFEGPAHKDAATDDMEGASWIRTRRNYGYASKGVTSIDKITVGGEVIYENGEAKVDNPAIKVVNGGIGSGASANEIRWSPIDDHKALNATYASDGIYKFKVSSDCTVVIWDKVDFGYPTLEKYSAENPDGWKTFDKEVDTENSLSKTGKNYYKEFSAGDEVIIPGYNIQASEKWDSREAVVEYTAGGSKGTLTKQVSEFNVIPWDIICIGVKWSQTVSDDATLSDIKVDGVSIADFDPEVTEYTVVVPYDTDSVTLSATANDADADVDCPATVEAGSSETIIVTAENGATKIYTVNIEKEDVLELSYVKYKTVEDADFVNDAAVVDSETYSINVASDIESIKISAEAENSEASVSYETGDIALEAGILKTVTITVEYGEAFREYTVKILREIITDIEGGIEEGGEI